MQAVRAVGPIRSGGPFETVSFNQTRRRCGTGQSQPHRARSQRRCRPARAGTAEATILSCILASISANKIENVFDEGLKQQLAVTQLPVQRRRIGSATVRIMPGIPKYHHALSCYTPSRGAPEMAHRKPAMIRPFQTFSKLMAISMLCARLWFKNIDFVTSSIRLLRAVGSDLAI